LRARLDAEEWRDLVNAYLDAASAAVIEMGGHVAKKLGDGLMALFGYPLAHENDAERAARAALSIQRALDDRQERIVDPHLERGGDHRRYYQQRPSYRHDEDRHRGLGDQPGDSDHRDGAAGGDRGVCRPHVAQVWEGTEVAGPSTGPHETAMHLIHEPISLEEGNGIVAELNPAIDFERYGGKPVPRWARSRMANTPVPENDPPW
jgi:hypothetical protein